MNWINSLAIIGISQCILFCFSKVGYAIPQDPWDRWLCISGTQLKPSTEEPASIALKPDNPLALLLSTPESLTYPLRSRAAISSGFGLRIHPTTGLEDFHQGIDLAAPTGTPILAAYSGSVITAGPLGNLGNAVVLQHSDRRTRYGHMSSVVVQPDTWVEQGQTIGYVGSTGRSTGPHLHFELWQQLSTGAWVAINPHSQLLAAGGSYPNTAAALSPVAIGGGSPTSC